jgi:hypothetical protein
MDSPSKPEVGIIRKNRTKRVFKPSEKRLKAILLVLFVGVIGGVIYLVLRPAPITAPMKVDINDVSDYSEMTYEQKNYYLYTKTGLTIEHLKSQRSLTSKTFKTFDAAYESGKLFFTLGEFSRSKQSYAAAEAKGAPADDYDFHLQYAYTALLDKDKTTWKQQMLTARDIASKLPTPKDDQPSIAKTIDSQIRLTESAED